LHTCNSFVAQAGGTHARLTMNNEMATLYSNERRARLDLPRLFRGSGAEGTAAVNRMFLDLLRHFVFNAVAKRRHYAVAAMAAAVGLAGCAGMQGPLSAETKAEVKQERVAARAQGRWDALIKGDLDGAYAYMSPASKASMPLDLYKAKHKVGMYRTIKVDKVACEAEVCTVALTLTYDFKQSRGIATPLTEKWIISQGQAWFVDRG
jgi:hypothetical protein